MRTRTDKELAYTKLLNNISMDKRDVMVFALAYAVVINNLIYKSSTGNDLMVSSKNIADKLCELTILDRKELTNKIVNVHKHLHMKENTSKIEFISDVRDGNYLGVNKYISNTLLERATENRDLFSSVVIGFDPEFISQQE